MLEIIIVDEDELIRYKKVQAIISLGKNNKKGFDLFKKWSKLKKGKRKKS